MGGLDFEKPEDLLTAAAVLVGLISGVYFLGPFLIPLALIGIGCWIGIALYTGPAARTARARREALRLYETASRLRAEKVFPDPEDFSGAVWKRLADALEEGLLSYEVSVRIFELAEELYRTEGLAGDIPTLAPEAGEIELARYRDRIEALIAKFERADIVERMEEAIFQSLSGFCRRLPPAAFQEAEALVEAADAGGLKTGFRMPLIDAMAHPGEAVERLLLPYFSAKASEAGLFSGLRHRLSRNQYEASGIFHPEPPGNRKPLLLPHESKAPPRELVPAFLRETPLEEMFAADIPFDISDGSRFEHHWIVAGSGHGKSQTLQYMIAQDLERVGKGEASVIVIDSQGDLIRNIAGLKCFASGEALHGRLCLIDPSDIEYPLALNLFDAGMERIGAYAPLERERLVNGILELYDFVLGSLLSAELTQKQSVIFRYITRLMLHIPDATIHTFRELMEPKGYETYKAHIEKLDGTARAFFETEFNSKQFEETKRQVVRRLWGILENRTFERMFSHPRNKLDLFAEMNEGKVILINTAKDLLKQNGTEIFGRFFIALIAQAAQERATLARGERLPTFVYVDECADYLDQNVSVILEQARKYNVGMVLAHQYIGQLSPKLQESFAANTSIKFAGGVSEKDARVLAPMLHTTLEFIGSRRKGEFAVSVRNVTDGAVSLDFPFGHLEALPRMSAEEAEAVRGEMRERYAVHWQEVEQGRAGAEMLERDKAHAPVPAEIDTAPSSDW
ncbi:MAG: hypothetical protein CMI62_13545 [Parvibaculum sp.]|jgi:hypothetical protein|uniref:type IV secretory system conjugative DNA transfer family protein n=1 Tax=Parvibaculum sp. TaxID=2024848 RepID=UPI000C40A361|nr:ATP-binding protein [Parvibaculum sp.]MAU61741.1 hypothetical protein [Parvibaculum sp.]|tara:strand:- start:2723 stop:4942 length:2220 start_codon:yes stop_codon:yes gene_type:complete